MSIQLIDTGTQNSKQCNNSAQGEKNKLVILYTAYVCGNEQYELVHFLSSKTIRKAKGKYLCRE